MRVVSGIKPSGKPHLGNYLGAMRYHIEMQKQYPELFFFVANYHALTTLKNPKELEQNTKDIVLDYLALGLDPKKAVIFKQSDVPEVTELSWIFSCLTPLGLLERAHAYKDALARGKKNVNHGLFAYPVLMAADILIYQGNFIPVGKDQVQHVEIAREIARAFNRTYGKTFVEPKEVVHKETQVILGTDRRKMSKSYNNTIEIFAAPQKIEKKVMSMITDVKRIKMTDPGHPDECNVFHLHQIFTPNKVKEIEKNCKSAKLGCVECKKMLAKSIIEYFEPYRKKREQLAKQKGLVEKVLKAGANKARAAACETMKEVRKKVGVS
jgi:tryptophanyl-tRNA synthetase